MKRSSSFISCRPNFTTYFFVAEELCADVGFRTRNAFTSARGIQYSWPPIKGESLPQGFGLLDPTPGARPTRSYPRG